MTVTAATQRVPTEAAGHRALDQVVGLEGLCKVRKAVQYTRPRTNVRMGREATAAEPARPAGQCAVNKERFSAAYFEYVVEATSNATHMRVQWTS